MADVARGSESGGPIGVGNRSCPGLEKDYYSDQDYDLSSDGI
jgi:hypothetical protein